MATKRKHTHEAAIKLALKMHKRGTTNHYIAKHMNENAYPTQSGRGNWYFATVDRVLSQHMPGYASQIKKSTPKTAPTKPIASKQVEAKAAIGVLDYFSGENTSESSQKAGKQFADTMATAEAPEQRRGHKRMTRDGWESLPEPVREAVVERIYRDVVGL